MSCISTINNNQPILDRTIERRTHAENKEVNNKMLATTLAMIIASKVWSPSSQSK